ncbi:MAG: hypothetical protein ACK559_22800, partial [bacterium]
MALPAFTLGHHPAEQGGEAGVRQQVAHALARGDALQHLLGGAAALHEAVEGVAEGRGVAEAVEELRLAADDLDVGRLEGLAEDAGLRLGQHLLGLE